MIIKILGIFDIAAALLFFLSITFRVVPSSAIWAIGFYLIIKGVIFLIGLDIASIIDVICGAIMLSSLIFAIHPILGFIVNIYLMQKGLISIIA